jgi:hypothetical protein
LLDIDDLSPVINEFVVEQNKSRKHVTAQLIAREVKCARGIEVHVRTMRRICRKLGYAYVRGKKRHYLAESSGNVAFRATYVQKKRANRQGQYGWPRNPDVFLDESHCNVNHVAGRTWLTSDRTRYEKTGKGTRYVSRNSTLKPKDDDDYHGNFDTVQFERWFENLCTTLQAYGRCHIHMDGGSYHKSIVNKQPTTNWRKADIHNWLTQNGT